MLAKAHRTCDPLLVRNKRGPGYMALRDVPQCLCGFEYRLLMVVLCCYAVAGAPEVPLERLQSSNAPLRDPGMCRHSPTHIY